MSSETPTIKQIESFVVTGLNVRTQNSDEYNEKTAKIPNLWQRFYTSELAAMGNVYSVYSNYDSDANGFYTVTVGTRSSEVRGQFGTVTIQGGNYLVFQGKGPMPAVVINTWKQIWSYFATNTDFQRNYISDFEAYDGADQVSIYIGIK